MKKSIQKFAALVAAFTMTFPACSFADDGAAPEPANAPAAEASAQTGGTEAPAPGPVTLSTITSNTIVTPTDSKPAFEMLER